MFMVFSNKVIYRHFGKIILRCIYLKLYKILVQAVVKYGSNSSNFYGIC